MEERVLFTEDFSNVPHGSYKTNIPGIWTEAYAFEVPNGLIYKLDTSRPAHMKITAYEKFTGVNTAVDFTVTVSNRVAVVRNPKSNQIEYEWMAIARGRTSGKVTYAVAYDEITKQLTFTAISGGTTEDIDVFYLVADGSVRVQVTAPSRAKEVTFALFESSLDSLNSNAQYNVNQLFFLPADLEMRAGWKLEIVVNTPATILLRAQDISDASFTTNWNEIGLIEIPVLTRKE
jgi:hypothetical protein